MRNFWCKLWSILLVLFWWYSLDQGPSFPWVSPDWAWWSWGLFVSFWMVILYSITFCYTVKGPVIKVFWGVLFLSASALYFAERQLAVLSYVFGGGVNKSSYLVLRVGESGTNYRYSYHLDAKDLRTGRVVKINIRPRDLSYGHKKIDSSEICIEGQDSVFGISVYSFERGRCAK